MIVTGENPNYAERNLPTRQLVHHKSHVDSFVFDPGPPRREVSDRLSEPWCGLKRISLYSHLYLALQMVCTS